MAELLLKRLALGGTSLSSSSLRFVAFFPLSKNLNFPGLVFAQLLLPLELHLVNVLLAEFLDLLGVVASEKSEFCFGFFRVFWG